MSLISTFFFSFFFSQPHLCLFREGSRAGGHRGEWRRAQLGEVAGDRLEDGGGRVRGGREEAAAQARVRAEQGDLKRREKREREKKSHFLGT